MNDAQSHWLGDNRNTPAGRAWDAIHASNYAALGAVIDAEGEAALEPVAGPIGHPVTVVTAAARRGDTKALSMVLDAGADPHHRASGHLIGSPMAWAIEAGSLGCIELLTQSGRWNEQRAPTGADDQEDWADLAVIHHDHIAHPGTETLAAVLATGAPPSARSLARATENGIHQDVEVLLEAKADPNATDPRTGTTPLAMCFDLVGDASRADTSGPRMIRILLGAGADPNAWSGREGGHRPRALVAAMEAGADWAVAPLRDAGADVDEARTWMRRYGLRTHARRPEGTIRALIRMLD